MAKTLVDSDALALARAWIHDAGATLRRDLRLLREEGYNSQTVGVIERLLARADALLTPLAPVSRPPSGKAGDTNSSSDGE